MRTRGIKHFARLAFLVSIVSASCGLALGQSPVAKSPDKPKPNPEIPVAAQSSKSDADESFELNIGERRFTETNFEASTAVDTTGDSRNVNVVVGVSLTAGTINVLLRNVRGSVRFRGTLDRIRDVIGRRPASPSKLP